MQYEAIIKLRTRPLRLVYLVDSLRDLENAVSLYTHMWGGFSNSIIPIIKSEKFTEYLRRSLDTINPDYILLPEIGVSKDIRSIVENVPSALLQIYSDKIPDIGNLEGYNGFIPIQAINSVSRKSFPHMVYFLEKIYQTPHNNSNLFVFSANSSLKTETLLQFGHPTFKYQRYLRESLGAILIEDTSEELLFKASLLSSIGRLISPIAVTRTEINTIESGILDDFHGHIEAFNLFLYEQGDINIGAGFWNLQYFYKVYNNKLIFSKSCFVEDIEKYILLLFDFIHFIRELYIYINLAESDAENLLDTVREILNKNNLDVFIKVYYQYNYFDFYSWGVYHNDFIDSRRNISPLDKSIRFTPQVPPGLENSDCAFGYDAEIELSSGKSWEVPLTQSSAILLSNSTEQIKHFKHRKKRHPSRNIYNLKTQPVRGSIKGVTGIATFGQECCVYLPDSKDIVSAWLKDAGFIFKLNDHTRYAEGFIKRFGGLKKIINLVNSGGTKIFIALGSKRAKACGFKHSEIIGFLSNRKNNFNLNQNDAKQLVNINLPNLLKTKQVFRGYGLTCPNCGLQDWYGLDKVSEFVECNGCAENFQLESLKSLEFSFKPNELAMRFLNGDGQAILSAMTFLSPLASQGHIQLGGDISQPGEKNKVMAEIDLFVVTQDFLLLVECKSCRFIDEDKLNKIIDHLNRVIETALKVNAQIVFLAITTTSISKDIDLHSRVTEVSQSAIEKGISVHLLINNKLYSFGKKEQLIEDLWTTSIDALVAKTEFPDDNLSIEKPVKTDYGEGEQKFPIINQSLIKKWIAELISHKISN